MNKTVGITVGTILVLLCTHACTADYMGNQITTPSEEGCMILFEVSQEDDASTKAVENSTDNLASMRLYAYLTSSDMYGATEVLFDQTCTPNWMNAVEVTKSGDTWSVVTATANNRFHPSSNHSFFAFAPYDMIQTEYSLQGEDKYLIDGVITTPTSTGTPVVKYTIPTLQSDMEDILYASHLNVIQDELIQSDGTAKLKLNFQHALSKLTFTIQLKSDIPNNQEIRIHGISLANTWISGKLHFCEGDENSNTDTYGNENTFSNITWFLNDGANVNTPAWDDSEYTEWSKTDNALSNENEVYNFVTSDKPLYVIPQPLANSVAEEDIASYGTALTDKTLLTTDPTANSPLIMMAYHLVDEKSTDITDHSNIRGVIYNLYEVANCPRWEPGMAYHYTLTLDLDETETETIIVPWAIQVDVTDWLPQQMDVDIYGGEFKLTEGKTTYTMPESGSLQIPYESTYQYIAVTGGTVVDTDPNYTYIDVPVAGTVTITVSNAEISETPTAPQRTLEITVKPYED